MQEVLQKHADSRAVKQAQHHQFREKQQQQRQQHEQRRQDKEQRRALKDKAQAGPRDQAQQDQQPQDQTDGALSIATPFARISADRAKEQLLQPLQRSSAGSHADDHADEQPKLRGSSGDLRPGSVARPEISFDAPGVPQTLAVRTASAILAAQARPSPIPCPHSHLCQPHAGSTSRWAGSRNRLGIINFTRASNPFGTQKMPQTDAMSLIHPLQRLLLHRQWCDFM